MVGDLADPMSKLGVSKYGQPTATRERFNTQSAQSGRAFGLQSFTTSPQVVFDLVFCFCV